MNRRTPARIRRGFSARRQLRPCSRVVDPSRRSFARWTNSSRPPSSRCLRRTTFAGCTRGRTAHGRWHARGSAGAVRSDAGADDAGQPRRCARPGRSGARPIGHQQRSEAVSTAESEHDRADRRGRRATAGPGRHRARDDSDRTPDDDRLRKKPRWHSSRADAELATRRAADGHRDARP